MPEALVTGLSRSFSSALETADLYARSPWPVLLLGETGVGKELVARRIHLASRERHGPFVPVNCGALPPGLFESELFGYERGAFSGAAGNFKGLVRQAHGGILFLDEIGDMDLGLQVKLLRFLDSGEVRALGSARTERASVRVIAATNVNLHGAANGGNFRRDLLERLSVLTVKIPPLRERVEDIPSIAERVLADLECSIGKGAIVPLQSFEWPGNVRQLRNLLVRASLQGAGVVTRALTQSLVEEERALAAAVTGNSVDLLTGSLAEIEKQVIVARLRRCHGNRKQTAEDLGIAKSTLHEKLRRWKTESSGHSHWAMGDGGLCALSGG